MYYTDGSFKLVPNDGGQEYPECKIGDKVRYNIQHPNTRVVVVFGTVVGFPSSGAIERGNSDIVYVESLQETEYGYGNVYLNVVNINDLEKL